MKKSEAFFSSLLIPVDYIMVVLAAVSAYYIRFADFIQNIRPIIFDLDFSQYFKVVLIIALLWSIIFVFSGLYSIRSARRVAQEIFKVVSACSIGLVVVVILIFFRRELFDSRFIVLAAWILAIFYVSIARAIVRGIQRQLFIKGIGVHKVILVGNGSTADKLMQEFSTRKKLGYEVVKRVRDFSSETAHELGEFIASREVDTIIQSDPNLSKVEVLRLFDFANDNHISFRYVADLLGVKVLRTSLSEISGIPVAEVKRTTLDGWGVVIKRFLDIVAAIFFIILFSPVLIITALLIKIDSSGPVLYLNKRVGKSGHLFNLYKFRSMQIQYCTGDNYSNEKALAYERELIQKQNSKDGPVYKIQKDPRVTGVGRFIRRWSIDELPQFFNVLKGDMSIVGPRPHQPREVAQYENRHRKTLTIKPGITGLAQISGRSDLSFEEEVKLDIYYIENWSVLFDIRILFKTPWAIVRPRKVE